MNSTDDLIEQLAARGASPAASALLPRFALPLVGAVLLCMAAAMLVLGDPLASMAQIGAAPVVVKWGFSLAIVLLAPVVLYVLGKPGQNPRVLFTLLAVPFAFIGALWSLNPVLGTEFFPGATWARCLAAMALLSPVAFAGAIGAMRTLAPTDCRRAGLVAGLFGGAVAMAAYTPYCPERGMAYLLAFYWAPIALMAAIGWLAGPRLLRW